MSKRRSPIRREEIAAVALGFLYFFCLLSSWYILRPIRDEFGVSAGVSKLPWLFTGTFFAMLAVTPLFAWVCARAPRRKIVPLAYHFFALNLIGFYVALRLGAPSRAIGNVFFIWTSVYNLFVVSVFWSLMADLFDVEQAGRLFGMIAVGGSVGAVVGPSVTATLAQPLGAANLLLVSAVLLEACVVCVVLLVRWSRAHGQGDLRGARDDDRIGGGVLAGMKLVAQSPLLRAIAAQTMILTALQTILYFLQADILGAAISDPETRTSLLASMDLAVNVITIPTQAFLTGRAIQWLGVGATLAIAPLLSALGLAALAVAPLLAVLVAAQIARRAAHYAVERPAREALFAAVGREEKYKSKNFLDTVVYRAGDMVSGWGYLGIAAVGIGAAAVGAPLALLGVAAALVIGFRSKRTESERSRA